LAAQANASTLMRRPNWAMLLQCVARDWTLEKWLKGTAGLKDYSVIIRHTASLGNRHQVRFILAGFTEDNTVAAGRYFVDRWESLWREFVDHKKEGTGDFVVVISGDSKTEETWQKMPDVAINHQKLQAAAPSSSHSAAVGHS
jgi:hypothetical protein